MLSSVTLQQDMIDPNYDFVFVLKKVVVVGQNEVLHCLQKGLYFKDLVLNKDLFGILGPYLYFRVLIFAVLASFTQRMSI